VNSLRKVEGFTEDMLNEVYENIRTKNTLSDNAKRDFDK
jgi:hypothetical protein